MTRIVLDTSVIVAVLRSRRGASSALLGMVVERVVLPIVTLPLVLEYEDVLKRPDQLQATGLTDSGVDRFPAAFVNTAEGVDVHFRWRLQTRDPGDEMVLEAAINGRADALVTHNVRDFVGASGRFGFLVLTPNMLLKRLKT